jgi:hypothetical protein
MRLLGSLQFLRAIRQRQYTGTARADRDHHSVSKRKVPECSVISIASFWKPETLFGAEKLVSRLQSYGEPWTFGLHPEELAAYLAARGLRLTKDLGAAEIWRAACRPNSELHGYEFYRLASACVEGFGVAPMRCSPRAPGQRSPWHITRRKERFSLKRSTTHTPFPDREHQLGAVKPLDAASTISASTAR